MQSAREPEPITVASEAERIQMEYARRAREIPPDFYSLVRPANLFIHQQRERAVLAVLRREGLLPLGDKAVLEVGCGTGAWLADLERWGAHRPNLAGMELDSERAKIAQARFAAQRDEQGKELSPGADIRAGDASQLPWPDSHFDFVLQSTVFTSILDPLMKKAVAREMARVLRQDGVILWYDFLYNNPRNPHVRGVGKVEIKELFPGFRIRLRRVTLAPPLTRRLVPLSWSLCLLLEKLMVFNTHYLAIIRRAGSA